jgi:uncharacterized protein (DUF924 family)
MIETINTIVDYWFGELDEQGLSAPEQHALWFKSSLDTDRYCLRHFGDLVEQAIGGELDHWADSDRGLIALIVLLDQFPRNIFRGTARAFSGDSLALALALRTIKAGDHRALPAIHQVFLYLPLEHSENLEVQQQCLELFAVLKASSDHEKIAGFEQYALAHRDVIARFGRFPHRNTILGRPSTEAELTFMETHAGF